MGGGERSERRSFLSAHALEPGNEARTVDDVTAVYVGQLANERVYIIEGEHAFLL